MADAGSATTDMSLGQQITDKMKGFGPASSTVTQAPKAIEGGHAGTPVTSGAMNASVRFCLALLCSTIVMFPGAIAEERSAARASRHGAASSKWPLLEFDDPLTGKIFYLFDALGRHPEVRTRLQREPALAALRESRLRQLATAASSCGEEIACQVKAMSWSEDDVRAAREALESLATRDPIVSRFVRDTLRPSGAFFRHQKASDAELLGRAWADAAAALDRILDVYALGTPPLYPKIDSVSYDVNSTSYKRLIDVSIAVEQELREKLATFYDPTLAFALRLLRLNARDEAARLEPLHRGENAAALRRMRSTNWSRYPYTAIIVLGSGPDRPELRFSPWGRVRLEIAAARYRERLAPFILVSGGYVHPAQTPYNEALEMKRVLIAEFHVPAEAILVEPHARHTTTNLRNAARILLRYGVPSDRPALVTTDPYHSAYLETADFRERCQRELGAQPGTLGNRVSPFDVAFVPSEESLHVDATDPLDP